MVYQWKQNRFNADAQKVGEELEKITNRSAANVLRAARKKNSELHKCFEWDDAKASELYRLDQARYLLRLIVTEVPIADGASNETITVRAYEAVQLESNSSGMVYVPVQEALSTPCLREQVTGRLNDTIAEAEETARKYEYLVPSFGEVRTRLADARALIGCLNES